jgi:putative transposase
MCPLLSALLTFLMTLLRPRLALQLEIVALRHQVAIYQRSVSRPRLHATDRLFWVWLSRLWSGWQHVLVFVQPRTVIAWQRQRFRDHW